MKIVRLKAGFGNQLFQYAFGIRLGQVLGCSVKYDIFYFEKTPEYLNSLMQLNLNLDIASDDDVSQVCYFSHKQKPHSFLYRSFILAEAIMNKQYYFERNRDYVDISQIGKYEYFDGYWQSWRYLSQIKHRLIKEFYPKKSISFEAQKDIEFAKQGEKVCVGLRFADYNKENRHYYIPDEQYYSNAIRYCLQNLNKPEFYVFSDDIERAKKLIHKTKISGDKVHYREKQDVLKDHEELLVMSSCKHAIIPNSTFHWWAAWLKDSKDSLVVAPKHWFVDGSKIDIIPPSWVKIGG